MNGTLKLVAAGALASAALLFTPAAAQEQKPAARPGAGPLTPQERRGRALYRRGEGASGKEVTALVGEVDVPASTLTCAGCHGARAEGKTEGGVAAGALDWGRLLKPEGHTHPTGRRHGPFTEASFARAVAAGVDPAGNALSAAMPRYRLSAEETADLVAYLKRVESEAEPGVTGEGVGLATLLPAQGPMAPVGAAMRDVLAAYFAELNAGGGVHGRRVGLRVVETGASAAATAARARELAEGGEVFAFVGGVTAGADAEILSLARELEAPFVGPSTLLTAEGANRHVFYLAPGVGEQARALVNFHAGRRAGARAQAAVVHAGSALGAAAAAAAGGQCLKAGCGPARTVSYAPGKFDAAALVRSLKGAEAVFFFGAGGDEAAFVREAEAAGWRPDVYLIGALTGAGGAGAFPAGYRDKIFTAFPAAPSDVTPAGAGELRALAAKHKFEVRNTASQLAALAAAKVLAEGLKRAGRDLSRDGLITALEGLYEFETGLAPRLTFGPRRRVGASGAHVLLIDPETKRFVPAGGWVGSD